MSRKNFWSARYIKISNCSWFLWYIYVFIVISFIVSHYIVLYYESESEVPQSCPTLCDPIDCSPWGSSIHGIFQARILEWVAISFSSGSSQPRDWICVSRIAGREASLIAQLIVLCCTINIFIKIKVDKMSLGNQVNGKHKPIGTSHIFNNWEAVLAY